jgi:tubulin polyglutamylase TTLL9
VRRAHPARFAGEYSLFVEAFKKNPDTCWIMKPVRSSSAPVLSHASSNPQIGKSQGKGIFLFDKLNQINDWKNDNRWKPDNPQAEKYVGTLHWQLPWFRTTLAVSQCNSTSLTRC